MQSVKSRTLYITLSVLMIGLVALIYGVLLINELSRSDELMLQQASSASRRIGQEAAKAIEAEFRPAQVSVGLVAAGIRGDTNTAVQRLGHLPALEAVLQQNSSISAIYFGTSDGAFVLLRRLSSPEARAVMDAPANALYGLQRVDLSHGQRSGQYRFFDSNFHDIGQQSRPDYVFDPRSRPWYQLARRAGDGVVVQSEPYQFYTTKEPGLTLAMSAGDVVVGADVGLQALQEMLGKTQVTPSSEFLIASAQGKLVTSVRGGQPLTLPTGKVLPSIEEAASPLMRELWRRRTNGGELEPVQQLTGRDWITHTLTLSPGTRNGQPFILLMAAPKNELQAFQIESRRQGLFVSLLLVVALLPLVHVIADRVSSPLRRLAQQAEEMRQFRFDTPDPSRSFICEIDRLAIAMSAMKHSLNSFLAISGRLSAERDFDALLDHILCETIAAAEAGGGFIHLVSPDKRLLAPQASRLGGDTAPGQGCTWDIDSRDSSAAPALSYAKNESVAIDLHSSDAAHSLNYSDLFRRLKTSHIRLLAWPLRNRQDEVIGTLSLVFPVDENLIANPPLTTARSAFVRALSGTAAIAIDNQLLLNGRKELLESFIQLVAGAIDAKSPHTAVHCQRVPELTKKLAEAACNATEGPYADFQMTADEWEALHIGAWLHDCGKVTTPEYVIEKGTKLETIHNRIHEVRTRFEILKRDALIRKLEDQLEPVAVATAHAFATDIFNELDEEYRFVAACNIGMENMGVEQKERLRQIGQRQWLRTLDDRLGLSQEERRRLPAPNPSLPAPEYLLADRPEHLIPRPFEERLSQDNKWGFRMNQPVHLFNRGELHNLSISRGTLTEEERYKINEHIVETIKMLSELPFPAHLSTVPEIAGGHHERVDGKGYPRGLKGEQMLPQARMMAIADVFEALTTNDRPYKSAKPLSEALAIMQGMAKGGHLDSVLFDLFLESGVCGWYANTYIPEPLLDVIDVMPFMTASPATRKAGTNATSARLCEA